MQKYSDDANYRRPYEECYLENGIIRQSQKNDFFWFFLELCYIEKILALVVSKKFESRNIENGFLFSEYKC